MAHTKVSDMQEIISRLPPPERPVMSEKPPRILIIGAGSRGNSFARAISESTNGICVAVAEPVAYKRRHLGEKYIWGKGPIADGQEFTDWKEFLTWEEQRRRASQGKELTESIDAAFICVQDGLHKEVVLGLAPLGIHIMCEKPLATTLDDCISIYKSLVPPHSKDGPSKLFSIGHVLRYSPHNMLLRNLLLQDKLIGDIVSINHTEPVGWWHFTHSYVRGNWRKESTSAPSLLTKSCHDIDFILWLLCSPPTNSSGPPHLPSTVTATGALQYFKKSRKPIAAGDATNCLSCPYEPSCKFSAPRIYIDSKSSGLSSGNTGWPVRIVVPEIEEYILQGGQEAGEKALKASLQDDYDDATPSDVVGKRNWFGRCVYESDNDVCDDVAVTMTWDEDPIVTSATDGNQPLAGRGAKIATFHMVAFTEKICERYCHIYGTDGEVFADSSTIVLHDFNRGEKKVFYPHVSGIGGHGGGDDGLARQFVLAVDRVKNHGEDIARAQVDYIGCTIEEIIRSHAMIFAAEEARKKKVVLDFPAWWMREVVGRLMI